MKFQSIFPMRRLQGEVSMPSDSLDSVFVNINETLILALPIVEGVGFPLFGCMVETSIGPLQGLVLSLSLHYRDPAPLLFCGWNPESSVGSSCNCHRHHISDWPYIGLSLETKSRVVMDTANIQKWLGLEAELGTNAIRTRFSWRHTCLSDSLCGTLKTVLLKEHSHGRIDD
jgi:hypothetical protein